MSKIYLIRSQMILEVEMIKQTPEQLRVEKNTAKIAYNAGTQSYISYLSARLQRHREHYFNNLPAAVEYLAGQIKLSLERSLNNAQIYQNQLAEIAVFAETLKEVAPDDV